MDTTLLFYLLSTVLVAGLASGLRVVPDDVVRPLRRLGRFHRVLPPGWHLVVPFLDRLGLPVSLVGHRVSVREEGEGSAAVEVFFQILEPTLAGRDIEQIDRLVRRAADACLAEPPPAQERSAQALWLKTQLNSALRGLGLRVTRCQLR